MGINSTMRPGQLTVGHAQVLSSACPIEPRAAQALTSITGELDPLRTGKLSLAELQHTMQCRGLDIHSPSVRAFSSLCKTEGDTVDYTNYLTKGVGGGMKRRYSFATTSELHNHPVQPDLCSPTVGDPRHQITVRRPDGTVYQCKVPAVGRCYDDDDDATWSSLRHASHGRRKQPHSVSASCVDSVVFPRSVGRSASHASAAPPGGGSKASTVLQAYTGWQNGEYGKTGMLSQLQQHDIWPTPKATQLANAGCGFTFHHFLKAMDSGPTVKDSLKAQHYHLKSPSWCRLPPRSKSEEPSRVSAGAFIGAPGADKMTSKRSYARSVAADFIEGKISAGQLQQALGSLGVLVRHNGELDRLIGSHSRVGGHTVRQFTQVINGLIK